MSFETPRPPLADPTTLAASPVAVLAPRLGPALVLAVQEDGRLTVQPVRDATGPVVAAPAMAVRYRAEPGDTVLVIGQDGDWYVIGVLNGRGATVLSSAGDLTLEAVAGTVRVRAAAIELQAPKVEVLAQHIARTARTIVDKAHDVSQWITGMLDRRAGTSRLTVDGLHTVQAEHAMTLARKQVKIDGDAINLG